MPNNIGPDHYSNFLLREGDVLAIKSTTGTAVLKVLNGPDVIPYRHPDTFSNSYWWGPLSSQSGSDYKTIQTTEGYEVLYLNDSGYMYQVFQGWYTPGLKVFWRFPKSTAVKSLRSEIGSPAFSESADENFGWELWSHESMIDYITDKGMFFCLYQEAPEFAVFNPMAATLSPIVEYKINKIRVKAYDPSKPSQLEKIKNVLMGRTKPKVEWSPGTQTWEYPKFREAFGVDPVIYDIDTLRVVTPRGTEVITL